MSEKTSTSEEVNIKQKKLIATLLALFLGSFGVHRFYLGQNDKGLLYLLFCWTSIPFIISIVDVINFLCMNNDTFRSRYLLSKEEKQELKIINDKLKDLYSEIDKYLENGNFSEEVENNILKVFDLAISEEERNKNPYYVKIIKSKFVRLVSLGEIPSTPNNPIEASLNLQKGESIIRVFNNVDYSLMVNKIRYEGGSSGVSFRIAKGISFRTGSSRGEAVKHLEKKHISTGDFIITQKHIYFSSPIKSFKIPFSKIVSFQFYNDGISIQRDNHKSSPDIFQNSDARFLNNLFQVVVKNFG